MPIIRPYLNEDRDQVNALHAKQGFAYQAPDWGRMIVSGVIEEEGRIRAAAFLRKTAECYLVADDCGRKREKLADILILHRELLQPAKRVGFEDVHVWLPPEISDKFGKLLMHFGWTKPLWPNYTYSLLSGK